MSKQLANRHKMTETQETYALKVWFDLYTQEAEAAQAKGRPPKSEVTREGRVTSEPNRNKRETAERVARETGMPVQRVQTAREMGTNLPAWPICKPFRDVPPQAPYAATRQPRERKSAARAGQVRHWRT